MGWLMARLRLRCVGIPEPRAEEEMRQRLGEGGPMWKEGWWRWEVGDG